VGTTLSIMRSPRQPSIGSSCKCGPNCSIIRSRFSTLLMHSLRCLAFLDPRAVKDRFVFLWQSGIGKTAHDALTSRTIILQRVSILQLVIKSKLGHHLVQVIDPHLADKHRSASRTNGLFHVLRAALIKLDTN